MATLSDLIVGNDGNQGASAPAPPQDDGWEDVPQNAAPAPQAAAPSPAPAESDWEDVPSWGGYLPTAGNAAAQGAVSGVGQAMSGLAEMAAGSANELLPIIDRMDRGEAVKPTEVPQGYWDILQNPEARRSLRANLQEMTKPADTGLGQAGTAVQHFAKSEFPLTPEEQQSFTAEAAGGVGSMMPAVAMGAVGSLVGAPEAGMLAGAGQFGAMGAEEQATAARAKGAAPEQVTGAARAGFLTSAGMGMLPLHTVLTPVERTAPGLLNWAKARLINAAKNGVVFATIGEAQEWLGQEIAKNFYDPSAGYAPDARRAMSSLLGGFFMGGVFTPTPYHGAPREAARPAATATPEQHAANLENILGEPPGGPPGPPGAAPRPPDDESILPPSPPGAPPAPPVAEPTVRPPRPTEDEYVDQAMRNLRSTSRTAAGIVDVSSTPGKADRMEDITGDQAAQFAQSNYQGVIRDLHGAVNAGLVPSSGPAMQDFIDGVAGRVNAGIVKPDALPRVNDTKIPQQTKAADLPIAHAQFASELAARLADPAADPVETAAWIEWRANLMDHFWSDGVGKTSKALAAIPLMRAGLPLPFYPPNKDFFAATRDQPRVDPRKGGAAYLGPAWDRFNAMYHQMVNPQVSLRRMLDSGAPLADIVSHPYVAWSVAENRKQIPTGTLADFENPEWRAARVYDFNGEKVAGWDNAVARLTQGAESYAGGDVGQDHHAIIVLGPPAAGKSSIAGPLARAYRAAVVDADDAKLAIPEYGAGVGTNAVHEESSYLAKDVLRNEVRAGNNILLPKVGHSVDSIRGIVRTLKDLGYHVDLVHVGATPEISGRRNIQRFVDTGRLVDPNYVAEVGDKPREVAYLLKGEADGFADVDTTRFPARLIGGAGPVADAIRNGQGLWRRTAEGAEGGAGRALLGAAVPAIPAHRVVAADGNAVDVSPIVVEAGRPITSQDSGYDQDLQPRQRNRAAAQAQVRSIAANLDPMRLGYSSEADRGAPIIGPDGMVESGNGRVMALRQAYAENGPQIAAYRDWLARQGVDLAAYREPILVRQRTTPLTPLQRADFAVAANQPTTLTMSAPERALSDARLVNADMLGLLHNPDDLAAPGNRDFMRRFVALLPQTEQGTMADARGRLSAEGAARVRNAILAKAYDDPGLLSRLSESTDDDVRSISNALVAAAPTWARFRAEVEAGRVRPDFDVTPDLVEAIRRTADIRSRGDKLDEYLAQQDAFDRMPEAVEGFMRMFYDPKGRRAAGAQRIAEALRFYAEQASKVTTDKGLDLGLVPIEPRDILKGAHDAEWEDVSPEVSDRGGLGDGTRGQTVSGEARGPWLSEGRQFVAQGGDERFAEEAVRAQQPTLEELRDLNKPIAGAPDPELVSHHLAIKGETAFGKYKGFAADNFGGRLSVHAYGDTPAEAEAKAVARYKQAYEQRHAQRLAAMGAPAVRETIPGDGLEALIIENHDPGKTFNVTFRDPDSGQMLPTGFVKVGSLIAARAKAQDVLQGKRRPTETVTLAGGQKAEQHVMPGFERISGAELARRRAAEPLRPRVAQEIPGGLFGDLERQTDLEQAIAKAPLTPETKIPTFQQTEQSGGRPGAESQALRRGAQTLPRRAQPVRPVPTKRPEQLSLFGGGAGERAVPNADDAGQAQRRATEVAASGAGERVTKPPARSRGDSSARANPPAVAGLREAEKKIAERSRANYRITPEDHIGEGGPKQKVRQNIDAIRVLKQIEEEGRDATPGEKALLVKYVGWGAFAQDMFAPHKTEWQAERAAFRALATDDEYEEARASTLNAHFTSPDVISGMWGALDHLGFTGGKALEPAAGVGHFIGLTPDAVAPKTAWTATELDPLTGRIAKALYGGADVNVQGFETLTRPSNYFDLAISNVPFGNFNLTEKPYGSFPIHDFFFVKSLDKVRPGGMVAFITSRYTMDRRDSATRRLLAKDADLVGAIRLPGGKQGAFAGNAGTEVTTDVLFLRKKIPGVPFTDGREWMELREVQTPDGPIAINEYFAANPQMMMGEMRLAGTMYRDKEPVLIGDPAGLRERIAVAAAQNMPAGVLTPRATAATLQPVAPVLTGADVGTAKDGAFFLKDGALYQRQQGVGVAHPLPAAQHDRVVRLIGMRDLYNSLLDAQLNPGSGDAEALRKDLRKAYDDFVKAYGPINKEERTVTKRLDRSGEPIVVTRYPNISRFLDDPDAWKVASIENYNPETDTAKRADVQTKDVIAAPTERQIDGPADALAASLNDTGSVDLDHIARSLNLANHDEAAGALGDLIYQNPDGRQWETTDEYLSGNVVKKLEDAKAAAIDDTSFLRNVSALEKVQPTPLSASDIVAQFGAPWVPPDVYANFLREELGAENVKISRVPVTGEWNVSMRSLSGAANTKFGGRKFDAMDVVAAALNNKQVSVYDHPTPETRVLNQEQTNDARVKTQLLKEAFTGDPEHGIDGWVFREGERVPRLESIYNRTYNNLVARLFDGAHLKLPGINPDFATRKHRLDAVWRIIQRGNALLAHVVGSGKTVTMIAAGMEQKRLGLINKPAYVIPNHMLEQFSREFIQAYPNAKILVASKDETTADNRKAFLAKVASNDWDGVIITHDAFGRVNVSQDRRRAFIRDQLDELSRIIAGEADQKGGTVKQLEKAKKKLQQRLGKLMAEERKDTGTSFEESGIDFLFVDEAHKFKNLAFTTRMNRVKGLAQGDSQRAEDLFLKIRYLEQNRPGRSAVFATGTPVSNTMAELWTMMRYLELDKLKERDLDTFDAWANTFGSIETGMAPAPDGRTLREESSFSKFVNIPELVALYGEIADTKTADMLNLPRPEVVTRSGAPGIEIVEAELSPAEEHFMNNLVTLAESLKGQRIEPGKPNMASIATAGRKMATDGRLAGLTNTDREIMKMAGLKREDFDFNPQGKVALAVDNIHRIYQEGNKDPAAPNKVQMVFLDMGTPKQKGKIKLDKVNVGGEMWLALPHAAVEAGYGLLIPDESDDGLYHVRDDAGKSIGSGKTEPEAVKAALKRGLPLDADAIDLYNDIKQRLVDRGIPAKEIAFIHDATDDAKKARMFSDVRSGKIRVFMGSTEKMGVGTNVQDRLIAMHHLDAPWKPAEVEQRDGRIQRQGNKNDKVQIYRYVTKRSFDGFMWGKLDKKARFIGQVLSGAKGSRTAEDVDNPLPEAAEMRAAASGDPRILEHAELDRQVRALASQRRTFETTQSRAQWEIGAAKERIARYEESLPKAREDAAQVTDLAGDKFAVDLGDTTVADRKAAGEAILGRLAALDARQFYAPKTVELGTMSGFTMQAELRGAWDGGRGTLLRATLSLRGRSGYANPNDVVINEHSDPVALMMRFERILRNVQDQPARMETGLKGERDNLARLQKTLGEKWPKEADYRAALKKLDELTKAMKGPEHPDVTEAKAETEKARTLAGNEPDQSREAAPGQRVIRLSQNTVAHLNPEYSAAERKIADAVQEIGARLAPGVEVQGAAALRYKGKPVWGAFIRSSAFPKLIAWSLESSHPIETARHEIVHYLKGAGLIRKDEWAALEKAAKAGNWLDKYDINERYADISDEAKIEEAIAEQFSGWRADRSAINAIDSPLRRMAQSAFNRLDLFFRRVAAAARQFLGRDATADDVFSRIESGEVGRRETVAQQPALPTAKEIKVTPYRSGNVTRWELTHPQTGQLYQNGFASPEAARRWWASEGIPAYSERQQTPGGEARERRDQARAGQAPQGIRQRIVAASDALRERSAQFANRIGADAIAREMQIRIAPMAARDATVESRAIAKEYMNARRQARQNWNEADKYITEHFSPERRQAMWDAADEESVALQEGRPTQGIGLDRLTPEERNVVEMLQNRGRQGFDAAKSLDMVEGEGLPSYVPRMVVRMGESGKYERGIGPGAEVVRDIRTLALATAKLEDAIAARRLVNAIKEVGQRSGNPTVNEGAAPTHRIGAEGLAVHALDQFPSAAFSTTTPNLRQRKYLTREETEAAARRAPAADPNAPKWFTLNHPAFQVLRPKMVDAESQVYRDEVKRVGDITVPKRMMPLRDEFGNIVYEKVPIYIRQEFEGPLRAVLSRDTDKFYRALMSLKGKAMSVIMFSPLIHNQVEWGRALPAAPGKVVTFQTYFEGNRVANDPAAMRRAIAGGVVPIGGHGFMQDIVSIAEEPNLQPGRSWTAKGLGYGTRALGYLTHLYDPRAGETQVRRAIDWFGNLWHNTLLWDRVRDLQMGLWSHLEQHLVDKGFDPYTANVAAAHFANRYAGALPLEAMSGLARGIANVLLFSRTFTLGNIGAYKDALSGLPRDAQALIQQKLGWGELQKVQGYVKRKSRAMLAIDAGLYYATLSALQSAFHVVGPGHTLATLGGMIAGGALGGRGGPYGRLAMAVGLGGVGFGLASVLGASDGTRSLEQELEAYWNRFTDLLKRTEEHPLSVIGNPFKNLQGLLSTAENEPDKTGRLLLGYDKDGTGIYARLAPGKVTEELIGYLTEPNDMLHRKLSTFAKPIDQILENNIGFGRKAYDPNADTPAAMGQNIIKIAGMLVGAQLPLQELSGANQWMRGGPGSQVAGLQTIAPVFGTTISKGYPGGPELGVLAKARENHDYAVQQALPGIRDQIRQGDVTGAQQQMQKLGIPPALQQYYIKTTENPSARLTKRQMQDFLRYASPEERQQFFQAQGSHAAGGAVARAHGGRVEPANINHEPTEAQKKSGNYAKDHVHIFGLPLTIENARGSFRRGIGKGGVPWQCRLPAHYGYIKGSEGADGDHVDVYVGPHTKSPHVYVVDQVDAETKKFDEHKALLGFGSERQAVACYEKAFSDGKGKDRIGRVTSMTVDQFKDWLRRGDTTKPFTHSTSRAERVKEILRRPEYA